MHKRSTSQKRNISQYQQFFKQERIAQRNHKRQQQEKTSFDLRGQVLEANQIKGKNQNIQNHLNIDHMYF